MLTYRQYGEKEVNTMKEFKRTAEEEVRNAYGCFRDAVGNRPCDNGSACDYCNCAAFRKEVARINAARASEAQKKDAERRAAMRASKN